MTNRRILNYFLLTLCLFLFSSIKLTAGSASMSFSGAGSVYNGNNIEVTLSISNVNAEGGITAIGGQINYDSNYLEFVSAQSLSPITVRYEASTKKFAGLAMGGTPITGSTGVIRLTFRAKQVGNTTVSFGNASISDSVSNGVSVNNASKTISITNPPSGNNNLSSLSVSGGVVSFNKDTTSYSIKVGSDVTSVNISATAEDGGARISGTGTRNLNYGNNALEVIVTAANGATKTYTINVNRADNRSSNNNLSSLKVSGGDLKPGFKSSTTTYEITVPFSVSSLNVTAKAEDSKAKVTVSNNNNLPAEETTDVLVRVTAENGSVKTYTIKVTREKDPNKPLSGNNYLSSLTASIGMLSPVFNKEKLNYVIYLPYEVDSITFNAEVDDKKYGKLETSGPEKLNVGSNKYVFKVTTEDNTTREYVVNVIRGVNLENNTSNVLLKDIKINKGSLDKEFKSDINVYRYNKKKGFSLEPVPEDENTKVTVLEYDDVITIILESSGEDTNVYTLVPEESSSDNKLVFLIAIACSIPLIGGGTVIGYRIGLKKMLNKVKSLKPKEPETWTEPESLESPIINEEIKAEEKPKRKPKKEKKKTETKIEEE